MNPLRLLLIVLCLTQGLLQADTPLPRVLILGDSIYRQPGTEIAKTLKGKVVVVVPTIQPGEVFNSTYLLKNIDQLLGDKPWDVIHFNCGLGDLIHRAPAMKSFRVYPKPAGGIRATSADQYQQNLTKIVKSLRTKTDARLIWASTTPIRHSTSKVFEIKSEIQYNKIAAAIMIQNQIPINDMYQYVHDLINMDKPASHGADPFSTDKKPIHEPILKAIVDRLPE